LLEAIVVRTDGGTCTGDALRVARVTGLVEDLGDQLEDEREEDLVGIRCRR